MQHYDIVIIGGGPAGSTIGTLVKRYAPHLSILLLEKTRFPRHHVGESLLVGATPILLELGVYDKMNRYGFVEKLGANYVWGRDRTPWGFTFDEIAAKFAEKGQALPELYTKTWQVRRGEYDHILLKHAQERGVEVREEARVLHVLQTPDDGRVTGVEYRDAQGGTHTVASTLVMDCSGQDALLGRALGTREFDEHMNNYALFGYWMGARWKFEYLGHPDKTRIFIATTPRGWIWYIPVHQDIVSVGFVTHRRTLQDMTDGPEQLYRDEIAACDEIQHLLDGAALVRLTDDQTRDVCAIQDWSYTGRQLAGPGWAMAGDAAGFVDPILSSGVMLAHELGQKAAYTIVSAFDAESEEQARSYWQFYQDTYQTYLQAYRDMAHFWYGNNFSMESWWWQAQRTVAREDKAMNLTDRDAFTRVAFGYATRAESLSLFGSFPLHEAQQLVNALFAVNPDATPLEHTYANRPLRLQDGAAITDGMYFYQGRIRRTRRVVGKDRRYLDLHPGEEHLVKMLDGDHTLADLNAAIGDLQTVKAKLPMRNSMDLLVQLDNIGALV
jgi:clorobiocin biosynthesis protein Clo-hal